MVKAYLRYRVHDTFGLVATPACNVCAHPQEGLLFTCANEAILIWDSLQGSLLKKLLPPPDSLAGVSRLHLSISNPNHLVAAYADGKIRIWEYNNQHIAYTFTGHKSAIQVLAQR